MFIIVGCFSSKKNAENLVTQLNKKGYFDKESVVVIVFPDHGSRYMSKIYDDKWMIEQGFFDKNNNDSVNRVIYIN